MGFDAVAYRLEAGRAHDSDQPRRQILCQTFRGVNCPMMLWFYKHTSDAPAKQQPAQQASTASLMCNRSFSKGIGQELPTHR
jgi:hypothetical protein